MSRAFNPDYSDSTAEHRQLGAVGEQLVADTVGGTLHDQCDGYDGGRDVTAPDGTVIDVKTIDDPEHRLLVRTERQQYSEADLYVLVLDTDETTEIVGCKAADDVYDIEAEVIWHPMPPNDVHAVDQQDLDQLGDHL